MNEEVMNALALEALSKKEIQKAQNLFFDNAKNNPSYESFNNLGVYLCEEGLLCKNGKTRSAKFLSELYLRKSMSLKESALNFFAIAQLLERKASACLDKDKKKELYKQELEYFSKILAIEYSHEMQYNFLRILVLTDNYDLSMLESSCVLTQELNCEETARLYLHLLSSFSMVEKGLTFIEKKRHSIDISEQLMFFSKFGLYEYGYKLCDSACNSLYLDKYIASAVMECFLNTGHYSQARMYADRIMEIDESIVYPNKEKWHDKVLCESEASSSFRRSLIKCYKDIPPLISRCCYFGCNLHGNPWLY